MTDDAFERWCFVDDGSTFEEWLELDERRREAERLDRDAWANRVDREFWAAPTLAMLNAAQGPPALALMARQQQNAYGQQNAYSQQLPTAALLQQNALLNAQQGPLALSGIGHAIGGLGGLLGGFWT